MKSKNNILSVAIVVMLIMISSCSKRTYPQQSKLNFPLAVGNTWTYEETYYYNNIWDSLRSTRNMVRTITKDTILPQEQLAFIVEETTGTYTQRYMWYEKGKELIEAYFYSEHVNILITKDLKKGLAWDTYPSVDRTPENDEKRVVEELTSYSILGKQVGAFRLQSGLSDLLQGNKTGYLSEQLYAPQIGILTETYYANYYGPTRTQRVLTNYSIKE